ncbi:MAG: 3'(2'),5'-bisphosphate nucleotidase CysQ [Parcubacteria group bacterium]|nr:3'(2'),5'-bisphosphate nucleotidase CysQ [Parcubacteria group bacterium]
MPKFQLDTERAVGAARAAGEAILKIYKTDFEVSEKEAGQMLTVADTDADAVIHEMLAPSGYPILSEESADDTRRLSSERVWIVDPLDGTSDFVNRTGEFSIMIALVENHEPIIGVVYAPTSSTLYVAEKGKGAFCFADNKWKQLHVSVTSSLPSAKAVVSRHHFTDKERAILQKLTVSEFVHKGSAGLKIADITQGSAELYFTVTNKIRQWDTAAGYCILTEAGGRMTDMLGQDLLYNTEDVQHQNGILATNGLLHGAVIQTYHDSH